MKLYYPYIFDSNSSISALFSLSNREAFNSESRVPGLNLGYNTNASKEEVDQNFEFLFKEIDWDYQRLAIANQVHQTEILNISSPGIYDGTDGFVTNRTGLALGIRVADCAAILAADQENGVIGAFHAGWKGAAEGIVPKGIKTMEKLGANPENIRIYISPCISLKNFEVGEEVASKFPERFVDRNSYKKPHVDLKGFILWQLLNAGIDQKHIEISTECTIDDPKFYSYRRERDSAGRMLGLIKINES
ncbi:peptidoglycan editing factor PgeF [Rhodohalobacter halophilus]|uniref:peptidoglycan editing factor PgeF n=1 Tax=Rhodohalobacter halophilus TaxID=1812810 RepID=UPI00083FC2A6|nr:peptidoglycan editing factor PgeF [Rhodohalobacter halophilus]